MQDLTSTVTIMYSRKHVSVLNRKETELQRYERMSNIVIDLMRAFVCSSIIG